MAVCAGSDMQWQSWYFEAFIQEFCSKRYSRGHTTRSYRRGLARKAGEWEEVQAFREDVVYQENDERIVGMEILSVMFLHLHKKLWKGVMPSGREALTSTQQL
jgi:hypothetical protein